MSILSTEIAAPDDPRVVRALAEMGFLRRRCPTCGWMQWPTGIGPLCIFNKCNVEAGDQEHHITPAIVPAIRRRPWLHLALKRFMWIARRDYQRHFGELPLTHREIETGDYEEGPA